MKIISLLIGKLVFKVLRLTGRSASALPGLVVEKIHPRFLNQMLGQLPDGVIIITGTNGKTTTTKIITELLEAEGKRVLTNKTGSNFVRGTIASIVNNARLNGALPFDVAVFEQDEAHAVHFVRQVKPKGAVVLNIMRDQMDRFGEIDTTAQLIKKTVDAATDWVVLNANDERVSRLKPHKADTIWFGHSKELQHNFLTDDQFHHGDNTAYVKAGDMAAELVAYDKLTATIKIAGKEEKFKTPLNGSHNAINLAAALATVKAAGMIDMGKMHAAIGGLQPAFGRGEIVTSSNGGKVTLQLIKNPGGFTQALRMLSVNDYATVGVAINDDYPDGRDVSWLWDVDFAMLEDTAKNVITGGTRGYDMAVRLKYDGVPVKNTVLELGAFVQEVNALASNKPAIIFCTYTAMLKIRTYYKHASSGLEGVGV